MVGSWDKSYETGNAEIDSQHRQLISLLDRVDELENEPKSGEEVLRMLDAVMDLIITHFLMEEELMAEVHYPPDAARIMRGQHREFKSYVRLRILEFRQAKSFDVIPFGLFVKNFLETHEFGMDRGLAAWVHRRDEDARAA